MRTLTSPPDVEYGSTFIPAPVSDGARFVATVWLVTGCMLVLINVVHLICIIIGLPENPSGIADAIYKFVLAFFLLCVGTAFIGAGAETRSGRAKGLVANGIASIAFGLLAIAWFLPPMFNQQQPVLSTVNVNTGLPPVVTTVVTWVYFVGGGLLVFAGVGALLSHKDYKKWVATGGPKVAVGIRRQAVVNKALYRVFDHPALVAFERVPRWLWYYRINHECELLLVPPNEPHEYVKGVEHFFLPHDLRILVGDLYAQKRHTLLCLARGSRKPLLLDPADVHELVDLLSAEVQWISCDGLRCFGGKSSECKVLGSKPFPETVFVPVVQESETTPSPVHGTHSAPSEGSAAQNLADRNRCADGQTNNGLGDAVSRIVNCPSCKTRVIPKLDGACPSCQKVVGNS